MLRFTALLLALAATLASAQPAPPVEPTGWYPWAFDVGDPTLRELDLSGLLDAPAGKHGFVRVGPDGHLHFADGTRARFFGTDVGGAACCPTKEEAERVAERMARYGINLLRLHTPDSKWAKFLDYAGGSTRRLVPETLDRYDYFVAQLLKRGIYVYFDLLDYRQFLPADGVRDAAEMDTHWSHSIKGASLFDPTMIALQKEYATQLLTHRNPYTGRRYVDEPGLAVQELTNENSLFYLNNTSLMLPSYVADLTRLWNQWLGRQFGDRARLAAAWGGALTADEDPARGTVMLPLRLLYADPRTLNGQPEQSPARLNSMTRFLAELETAYGETMIRHLRSLGLKCPITVTNQDFSDAGNRAHAVAELMTRNNYWQHPSLDAKPYPRFSNAPLVRADVAKYAQPIANIASSTVAGKPMISPEFNAPWPNDWRAEGLPLLAAYGRLQDWDGLLYFAYGRAGSTALDYFGNTTDPVRWGQVPMAAMVFLRGDLDPGRTRIEVGVSAVDAVSARRQRTDDRYSPYRVLPFISQVRNRYFETAWRGDADVVISSGHSATGDYRAARHAIVFADGAHTDPLGLARDRAASVRCLLPGIRTVALEPAVTAPSGTFDTALDPGSLPRDATLFRAGGQVVGCLDDRHLAFPDAGGQSDPAWLHRLYLQAANRWHLNGAAPDAEAGKVFRSDTGQLVLDREAGRFTAVAPRVRIATGFFGGASVALGSVSLDCRTPFVSVSVVSLDAKPIDEAGRLLVTAVARAQNTGQLTEATDAAGKPSNDPAVVVGRRSLVAAGKAPVLAEPVEAKLSLPAAGPLSAWALDAHGVKGEALPVSIAGGRATIELAGAHSPWVLLVRG